MITSFPSLRHTKFTASTSAKSLISTTQTPSIISASPEYQPLNSTALKASHLVRFGSDALQNPVDAIVTHLLQNVAQGTDWEKRLPYTASEQTFLNNGVPVTYVNYESNGREVSCSLGDTRYRLRYVNGKESDVYGPNKGPFLTVHPNQGEPQTHPIDYEQYKTLSAAFWDAGNPHLAAATFAEWDCQLPQANEWQLTQYTDDSGGELNCIIGSKKYALHYSASGTTGYGNHSVSVEEPIGNHHKLQIQIPQEQYDAKLNQYLEAAKTKLQGCGGLGANLDTTPILAAYLQKLQDKAAYLNYHSGTLSLYDAKEYPTGDENAKIQRIFMNTSEKPEKANRVHIAISTPGQPHQSFYLSNPVELAVAKTIIAQGKLETDEQEILIKTVFREVFGKPGSPQNEYTTQMLTSLIAEEEQMAQAKAANVELLADVKTLLANTGSATEERETLLARIAQNLQTINSVKISTPYRNKKD